MPETTTEILSDQLLGVDNDKLVTQFYNLLESIPSDELDEDQFEALYLFLAEVAERFAPEAAWENQRRSCIRTDGSLEKPELRSARNFLAERAAKRWMLRSV